MGKHERGYGPSREKTRKGGKYVMSCMNCAFYRQEEGDEEELCQNSDVLEYDMVVLPDRIYCNRWKLSE